MTEPAGDAVARRLDPCGRLVRAHDRDRYWSAVLAPAAAREALFALYAFNFEIARVREAVSQPLLGEMRLEWWRESLEGIYAGRPRRHEVVEPLARAAARHDLPRAPFEALIDARLRDLDEAGFATLAELDAYAAATTVPLIHLALACLGADDTAARAAAGEIGPAYALSGLLRAVPFHARQSRVLLPAEAGLSADDVLAGRGRDRLAKVVAQVADHAAQRLAAARAGPRVARRAWPALVGAVQARRALAQLARYGHDVFEPRAVAAPSARPLRLLAWQRWGRL